MVFDVSKIPFRERVVDHYEDFKINGFEYDQFHDKLLRYTIFLYDKESDVRRIPDVEKRKEMAAELAKLDEIPDPEDKEVSKIQRHFFKVQGDIKYELLASGEELQSHLMQKIRTPVPKTKTPNPEKEMKTYELKTKCFHEAFKIQESLSKLEGEIFLKEEPKKEEGKPEEISKEAGTAEVLADKHTN